MNKVSKNALMELFDIVSKHSLIDKDKFCNVDFLYLKISSFLLYNNEELSSKKLHELREILENCSLRIDVRNFLNELEEWLKKHLPCRLYRLDILREFFANFHKRNIIDSMHYKDEEKVDAKTFMRESGIDEDLIEDLEEALKEFKETAEFNINLNNEYLGDILEISGNLRKVFTFSGEFKDLSLAFENLEEILNNLNLNELDESKKTLLKSFLDSIFEDIEKWFKEVIVKKSAKDIHYLDAALFANIEQIKILLTDNHTQDDDIEFF